MTTASTIFSTAEVSRVAARLWEAERTRVPIPPLSEDPRWTLAGAYAIQQEYIKLKNAGGARRRGRKVGLTSAAMQKMLGVDQPDWGVLLPSMDLSGRTTCSMQQLIQPKIEPEIAFRMHRELRGPGVTLVEALAAIDRVYPSLEIIDSRIADWKIGLVDTVADNASSALFLLGGEGIPVDALDLAALGVTFEKNDEVVATGAGSAVLGHPGAPLAWLANTLAPYGECIEAGEIVMPGALVGAVGVRPGDRVRARFGGLGTIEIEFTE